MLRGFHLADFFTLGNAACGVGAVLLAMLAMTSGDIAHFLIGAALLPAAFVMDVLDGRIARARHEHSPLADVAEEVQGQVQLGRGDQRRALGPLPFGLPLRDRLADRIGGPQRNEQADRGRGHP